MENLNFAAKILFSCFLMNATSCLAATLQGDFCMGTVAGSNFVIRLTPTDATHGMLSAFADTGSYTVCLGGRQSPYKINGNKLTEDQHYLVAHISNDDTIHIETPSGWSGRLNKNTCWGHPVNPCEA